MPRKAKDDNTPFKAHPNSSIYEVYRLYEREETDWRRPHLGASVIGHECDRFLWMSFRWSQRASLGRKEADHRGRTLRLFERGNREELWLAEDLRRAGFELWTHDEDSLDKDGNPRQFGGRWLEGHIGSAVDGVIIGLIEDPKTPHVWECKTTTSKGYKDLVKKGVRMSKPVHFVQMQIGMLATGLTKAYYTAVAKDTDDFHQEVVHLDKALAEQQIRRAELAVLESRPAPRIGEDGDSWPCKMCNVRDVCHGYKLPEVNCRTCAHSTAEADGEWRCYLNEDKPIELTMEMQRVGCNAHLYHPDLLSARFTPTNSDEELNTISYIDKMGTGSFMDSGIEKTELEGAMETNRAPGKGDNNESED